MEGSISFPVPKLSSGSVFLTSPGRPGQYCVLEVRGAPGPPFILKEQTWGPTAERALMFEQSLLREPVFKPLLRAGGP